MNTVLVLLGALNGFLCIMEGLLGHIGTAIGSLCVVVYLILFKLCWKDKD